jgi:drug/metabolite transporter superfamily protein YnfA
MAFDGFRPDRWYVVGALVSQAGVAVISTHLVPA